MGFKHFISTFLMYIFYRASFRKCQILIEIKFKRMLNFTVKNVEKDSAKSDMSKTLINKNKNGEMLNSLTFLVITFVS
jgi:hypothetical protein